MRSSSSTVLLAAAMLGVSVLLAATPVEAAGTPAPLTYSNSATYNAGYGMTAGQENTVVNTSMRDANGNLVMLNGVLTPANTSVQQGVQQSQSGVGTGSGQASAVAIGNSLNVQVTGSWNTVIVDSTQVNKGDQTATAALNGKITF